MHRSFLGGIFPLWTAHPGKHRQELYVHLDRNCTEAVPGRRRRAICLVGKLSPYDRDPAWSHLDAKRSVKAIWECTRQVEGVITGATEKCFNSNGEVALHIRGMLPLHIR